MIKNCIHIIAGLILIFILTGSCSTVKHLPENESLYLGTKGLKLKQDSLDGRQLRLGNKPELTTTMFKTLWVKPNGALLGMPFLRGIPVRLWSYNWFYTEKDSTFGWWMMENFGEPPLTIEEVNPDARVKYIENHLYNRGYFDIQGEYEIKYKRRKKNKAWIRYSFVISEPYTYGDIRIRLDLAQQALKPSIDMYMPISEIRSGEQFSIDAIATEKEQLWQHLQNDGFYHIGKDNILILADTTVGNRKVDMEYRIVQENPGIVYEKVVVDDLDITINNFPFNYSDGKRSEIVPGVFLRNDLLKYALKVRKDSVYRLSDSRATMRNLSSLGIFTEPVINYRVKETDSSRVRANLSINTTDLVNIGLSTNVTVKNTGYAGPQAGLFLTRKNLLGGAENLTLSLDGYLDLPVGVYRDRVSLSTGFLVMAELNSPAVNSPLPFVHSGIGLPGRRIAFSFELNDRVDFFRMAQWKTEYGLEWRHGKYVQHRLNLFNLSYSSLRDTTPAFSDLIGQSSLIRNSYNDRLIIGPSYTFEFNNSQESSRRLRTYFKGEIESSANLLNSIYWLAGRRETEKELLGVNFSQYVRAQSDFRAYLRLGDRDTKLAFRNIVGVGKAYGNSVSMPYQKQFFIGGSNSIRPFTARVLGPGRYFELDEASLNQTGDLRVETNLELRFKIWYIFHGALWSDLGNIWLLQEDPERPGSQVRWNNIITDSYLTSGTGIRLDLGFLVVRADLGFVIYLPAFPEGFRWIGQYDPPLFGLAFGIGYPF